MTSLPLPQGTNHYPALLKQTNNTHTWYSSLLKKKIKKKMCHRLSLRCCQRQWEKSHNSSCHCSDSMLLMLQDWAITLTNKEPSWMRLRNIYISTSIISLIYEILFQNSVTCISDYEKPFTLLNPAKMKMMIEFVFPNPIKDRRTLSCNLAISTSTGDENCLFQHDLQHRCTSKHFCST